MSEKIIFVTEEKIGLVSGSDVSWLNSQYLERYNKARMDIKNKSAWKTEGKGAAFMGVHNELLNFKPEHTMAHVNGVTLLNEEGKILYTISVNDMSGIFIKNPFDGLESEGHVIHKNDVEFLNIDFSRARDQLVVSVRENEIETHLAVLDVKKSNYQLVTEGECIDENPSWSKTDRNVVFYNSAGIATDQNKEHVEIGPRFICKLDLNTQMLEEVVTDEKYDFIKPKETADGTLYFIRRPYKERTGGGFNIADVFLFPFRLIKALFGWLNFFTMRYSGESLSSKGRNPAKSKEKSEQEIFIEGNLINAEKTLNDNKNSGEKYPGIAPGNWELMKMSTDGEIVCVKKGVVDYDINNKNEIVFSNGAYLIKLSDDKKEEMLGKARLVSKVKII